MQEVKMQEKPYIAEVTQAKIKQKLDQSYLFSVALNADNATENDPATTNRGQQFFIGKLLHK